jgi:hypothetical protein
MWHVVSGTNTPDGCDLQAGGTLSQAMADRKHY